MIKFHCSTCGQKLGVPDEYAGHGVRCNKCNERSIVPKPAPEIAEAEAVPVAKAIPVVEEIPLVEPVQSPPVSSPEVLEEFEEVVDEAGDDPDDARRQAIRQARNAREKAGRSSGRSSGGKREKPQRAGKDSGGGFVLSDLIPDILRLPLGLVMGLVFVGVTIGIWMMCARGAEDPLCFMALFVPIAGAIGLRLPVVERTFFLGLLAVVIGALGIAGGKAIMAKHVVVPYFEALSNEECLEDLPAVLDDPDLQFPSKRSIKPYATDGDFIRCIGLIALVDEGQADPKKVRKWAVHILVHSNKLDTIGFIDSITSGGGSTKPIPNLTAEDEAVMTAAYVKIAEWEEAETHLRMARKYYPALAKLINQAAIIKTCENEDTKYQAAFLSTLGLFDLLWVMVGLGAAYGIAAMDV